MNRNHWRSVSGFSAGLLALAVGCAAAETTPPGGGGDDDDGEGGSGASPGSGGSGNVSGKGGASGSSGTSTGGSGGSSGTNTGGSGALGGSSGASSGAPGAGGTAPRPPSITLPYTDDFETTNAQDWRTITMNSWSVVDDAGNNVFQIRSSQSDEELAWAVGGDRNWTDVRYEARVKFVSEGSAGDGMIYFAARFLRSTSDYEYYWVEFPSEGKLKVRKRGAGSSSDIVTTADDIVAGVGTWHTIALTLKGGAATLEYDGAVVGMGTDTAPLARGGIAISATDCVAAIDDVNVTAAP